jgi:succinoglycan biosynthesis protein ExoA
VVYYPRTSLRALARQYFNYGKGRARTLAKHGLRPKPRQRAMVAVAPALAIAPFGALFWPLALPALLWLAACLAGGAVLAWRARTPFLLLSGPVAAVMHAAWSAGFWALKLRPPSTARRPVPA